MNKEKFFWKILFISEFNVNQINLYLPENVIHLLHLLHIFKFTPESIYYESKHYEPWSDCS